MIEQESRMGVRGAVYDDEYPTCEKTSASFRVILHGIDSAQVTRMLNLSPDFEGPKVWYITTEKCVNSKDVRRHIDWLLSCLEGKKTAIRRLRRTGADMDVFCYWVSKSGQGGPILGPETMRRLANFELEIGFEIHFWGE